MPDNHDPFGRPEGTVIRPQPGAGRRAASDVGRSRIAPQPAATPYTDPIPAELRSQLGVGLNPLVRAASPLLLLAGQLRSALSPMDVSDLRRHALNEIRQFESDARGMGVPNETAIAARYVLCAALDEAVLGTPWGSQSEWAQHPLLVTLHREAWGGEKFFEMLERVSPDPARHIDLMELQYLVLALGFKGKYHLDPRGHEKLASVQHDLYRKIRGHRGNSPTELSLHWRGLEDRRSPIIRYVPWWVVAAAGLAVLAVAFTVFQTRLANAAEPLHIAFGRIGYYEPPPAPPPVVKGPTLKQLLRDEEGRGVLSVTERGANSIVTLPSADLFASGSATPNPAYEATIIRIAAALNQLPGRVRVIGHTDDQPLRSLRFQDNFQLSRERAMSVVRLLQRSIDNPARLTAIGLGPSQPAFSPPSDPANRARNRRVEIHHEPGA
jgi:type VI secretion system protein ImpK